MKTLPGRKGHCYHLALNALKEFLVCIYREGGEDGGSVGGGHMTEWDIKLPQNLHRQEH